MKLTRQAFALPLALILLFTSLANEAGSAELKPCSPGEKLDVVSYDWKLKGFLSIIAGLKFPTRGTGTLATLTRNGIVETELRILSNRKDGDNYGYRSVIELPNVRTLESVDGYAFGGRTKSDTTSFDYSKGTARRVRMDTKKGDKGSVRFSEFEGDNVKDVLTAIYHISQTAHTIDTPQRQAVFAGGKFYEVLITPGSVRNFNFAGRAVRGKLFTITATPENKDKWPGDVEVWITMDENRMPVQIDLGKSMASLKLDAVSRYSCP